MNPTSFQDWLDLPEEERLKYWKGDDIFAKDKLTSEINGKFLEWALKLDGVVEASVGNNHGSLDPRIEWKGKRKAVPADFYGIAIRNVFEPTEKELKKVEAIANLPIHKITQILIFIVMLPLAIVGGIVHTFKINTNRKT